MKRLINLHRITITRIVFLFALFLSSSIYSQFIRVNRLWGEVLDNGGNAGVSYGNSDLNLFADYGAYGCRFQGGESWFSGWIGIGMDNFNGGIAVFAPKDKLQANAVITTPLKNYLRYANPTYSITGAGRTTTPPANNLGTGATTNAAGCIGTSDQTITVSNKFYNGVVMDRKVMAWAQDFHNNYSIIDLTFTNTSSNTYTNFYVFMHDGEYQFQRADGTNPGVAAIDGFTNARKWYHYYGAKTTDSLRIFYNHSADDPEVAGDRIGQPLTANGGGRLLDYEFFFVGTLHASQQSYTPTTGFNGLGKDPNDADDMNQPSVTTYADIQNSLSLNPFNIGVLDPTGTQGKTYYSLMNGTLLANQDMTSADVRTLNGVRTHHRQNQDELGKNAPGGETGVSSYSSTFESMIRGFGPYTLAPGKQIRLVLVVGIAGMSRTQATAIGKAWYRDKMNGTNTLPEPTVLPDPTYGYYPSVAKGAANNFVFPNLATPNDMKKDRWVSTGIDSVHKTVSRAKYNFLHKYSVPVTPPPPTVFTVAGSGTGIKFSWQDAAAEAMSNFAGYRIMRKVGLTDTTFYQEVYRSNSSDKAAIHSWTDTGARPAVQYYYYMQALATVSATDQNAYPTERGKTIGSGRTFFYNNTAASPEAPLGSPNALDKIAIVPNPFNYNDPLLRGYSFANPQNLRITFYELPYTCTIKIFTENGDLVKTIEHNADSGKDEWNMVNEAQQTVASGVYIVVFQTPEGGMAYQKLVVVR